MKRAELVDMIMNYAEELGDNDYAYVLTVAYMNKRELIDEFYRLSDLMFYAEELKSITDES